MNHSLQEKILKMDMEQLNKIIENPELYSPEAVELVKKQVEALENMKKINDAVKAKFETMSNDEIADILKEPDLYSEDMIKLAKAHENKNKLDFSDIPEEAKEHLSKLSSEQLMDMLEEKEGIMSEKIVLFIKDLIMKKLENPQQDNEIESNQTSSAPLLKNGVSVEDGHYSMWKKFFSLIYRTVKTDLSFKDDKIVITKGTGFSKAKKFVETEIMYEDITSVKVRRKVDTTNLILAAFGIIGALITQVWAALFVVAVVLYWGLTAVATISYKNDMCEYDIPTEFKSDALDAKGKIDLALSQFGKKATDTTIL